MFLQPPQLPPPDLHVLVRPPPSLGSHPLNLQVQLLVPSSSSSGRRPASVASSAATGGTGSGARSLDAVAGASVSRDGLSVPGLEGEASGTEGGGGESGMVLGRSRSPSVSSMHSTRSSRSNRSATSGISYADSEGGGSGFGGAGGGRKRKVTPLLNLAYHSVLPTVVTDAGTDARVARFHKRGVELTGLAIFDPVELSSLSPPPPPVPSTSSSSATPSTPTTASHGRTSSNASTATATPQQASGSGFLGRFKRLGFSSPSSAATSSPSASSPSSSSSSDAPLPGSLPLIRTPSSSSPAPSRHPTSSSSAPSDEGYAFIPRRWVREDLSPPGVAPRGVEGGLRVEWARPGGGRRRRGERGRRRAGTVTSAESGRGDGENRGREEQPEDAEVEEEEEEEIDAEDDDRPWVCTLVYPLSSSTTTTASALYPPSTAASPRASTSSSRPSTSTNRDPSPSPPLSTSTAAPPSLAPGPTLRRLNLATLRPHPHHPTLISSLLLPPSLPSIPLGSFSPLHGLLGGSLSPEELRDLAMVTATWVAVREGLGGLGGEGNVREEAGRSSLGVKVGALASGAAGVGKGKGGVLGGGGAAGKKRFGLFGR